MIYFISAGNGSRMHSTLPKALHKIGNEPNLVRNIRLLNSDYRVVIDKTQEAVFSNYIERDKLILITSGLGSGHAMMQLKLKRDDIIIWGDAVILDTSIIDELKKQDGFCVPLKTVDNPYVNFLCDEELKIKEVEFSKYGETASNGLQDCCIFKVDQYIIKHLRAVHNSIWKSRYITQSNEFEFLYLLHYRYNIGKAIDGYITEYPNAVKSYNTVEELKEINNYLR